MTQVTMLMLLLAGWSGESERVLVASAKVRFAMSAQAELPDRPPNIVAPNHPRVGMSMTVTASAVVDQRHAVTLHTTTGCKPCEVMKASLAKSSRLDVTTSVNVIPSGVPTASFPFITFRDRDGSLRYNLSVRTADEVERLLDRHLGDGASVSVARRLTPDDLRDFARSYTGPQVGVEGMTPRQHLLDSRHKFTADQLTGLNDRDLLKVHSGCHYGLIGPSLLPQSLIAGRRQHVTGDETAAAGVIHAGGNITAALEWLRANIGEDVPMTLRWDRTGAQTFPLLAKGDWSALALFGRSGRIELSAVTSNLPVNQLGFGYRVNGDDIIVDADGVTLRGAANLLSPQSSGEMSASPMGIDPMTIWSVLSVIRSIYSLINPSADLQLGGNVSATAVLSGDMLAIDFEQMPSIRIVALFSFSLGVKRVELTATKVRLVFTGSRWIKERSFEVQ